VRNFAGLAVLFGEGAEGKRRGEMGLLIGTIGAFIRRGIEWKLREGGGYCSGSVTGGVNARKKMIDTWGPHVGVKRKRKRKGKKSRERGCGLRPARVGFGPQARPSLGWCPPLLFFCAASFLIFCFMICFITLTFGYQMHSNKFLNFCKIQQYILKQ
jgi:hypothetical protein